jgi:hypothetical protein
MNLDPPLLLMERRGLKEESVPSFTYILVRKKDLARCGLYGRELVEGD